MGFENWVCSGISSLREGSNRIKQCIYDVLHFDLPLGSTHRVIATAHFPKAFSEEIIGPERMSVNFLFSQKSDTLNLNLQPALGLGNDCASEQIASEVPDRVKRHLFERLGFVHLLAFLAAEVSRKF